MNTAAAKPVIALVLGANRKDRRRQCRMAARLHQHLIEQEANGSYSISVRLGMEGNEIRLMGDTRRQVAASVDKLFKMLASPQSAVGLYRYFARLRQRGEALDLWRAADLFRPDGSVTNFDAMGEA
jgi:hypothetical protein